MPLQRQNVDIPLAGGIDTKTAEKLVGNQQLLSLKNADVAHVGEIRKRNGSNQLPDYVTQSDGSRLPLTNLSYVKGTDTGLFVLGRSGLYSYNGNNKTWALGTERTGLSGSDATRSKLPTSCTVDTKLYAAKSGRPPRFPQFAYNQKTGIIAAGFVGTGDPFGPWDFPLNEIDVYDGKTGKAIQRHSSVYSQGMVADLYNSKIYSFDPAELTGVLTTYVFDSATPSVQPSSLFSTASDTLYSIPAQTQFKGAAQPIVSLVHPHLGEGKILLAGMGSSPHTYVPIHKTTAGQDLCLVLVDTNTSTVIKSPLIPTNYYSEGAIPATNYYALGVSFDVSIVAASNIAILWRSSIYHKWIAGSPPTHEYGVHLDATAFSLPTPGSPTFTLLWGPTTFDEMPSSDIPHSVRPAGPEQFHKLPGPVAALQEDAQSATVFYTVATYIGRIGEGYRHNDFADADPLHYIGANRESEIKKLSINPVTGVIAGWPETVLVGGAPVTKPFYLGTDVMLPCAGPCTRNSVVWGVYQVSPPIPSPPTIEVLGYRSAVMQYADPIEAEQNKMFLYNVTQKKSCSALYRGQCGPASGQVCRDYTVLISDFFGDAGINCFIPTVPFILQTDKYLIPFALSTLGDSITGGASGDTRLGNYSSALSEMSSAICAATFDFSKLHAPIFLGDRVILPGPTTTFIDSDGTVSELGFPHYPYKVSVMSVLENSTVDIDTGHGLVVDDATVVPSETWQCLAVYCWHDANGNIWRSAPSAATVFNSTVKTWHFGEVMVPTLRSEITAKADTALIELYVAGPGTGFNLAKCLKNDPSQAYKEMAGFAGSSIAHTMHTGEPALYTTGNVLENMPAPPSVCGCIFNNRIFLLDHTNQLWFSKEFREGEGIGFNEALRVPTPAEASSFTAIAPLSNGSMCLFSSDGMWRFYGEGPNDLGQGGYSSPVLVSSLVGAENNQSVLVFQDSIIVKSKNGFWFVGPDFSCKYIGAPVEKWNANQCLSTAYQLTKNTAYFLMNDEARTLLAYDIAQQRWHTHTTPEKCCAVTIWDDKRVLACENGKVFEESASVSKDGLQPYSLDLETAWFKVGGVPGLQRIWWVYVLGKMGVGGGKVVIDLYTDYKDTPDQTETFTLKEGDISVAVKPMKQKCQAIKVRVRDDGGGVGTAFTSLRLVCGAKQKLLLGTNDKR